MIKLRILSVLSIALLFFSCSDTDDVVPNAELTMPASFNLFVDENDGAGTLVKDLSNDVSTTAGTIIYSIVSQTVDGALRIDGSNLVVALVDGFNYEQDTIVEGTIKASVGDISKTATFVLNVNNEVDDIIEFLTTSKEDYKTLADNQWLEVTEAEYSALATGLKSVTVGALKDDYFTSTTSFTSNYTQSFITASDNSIIVNDMPANSYVFAFKFISSGNSNSGLKLKVSEVAPNKSLKDYGNSVSISNSNANKVHYFVMKSTSKLTAKGYSAIYTGTAGIKGRVTGKAVRYYYSGDIPTSSNMQGPTSNNVPSYQTLSTTSKQW